MLLGVIPAKAQVASRIDQYYQDFSIINPSTINASNKSSLSLFYNHLYTGVKGSPTNLMASAIFPNPEKHVGFGFNFAQEKIGFSTLYTGYVSYVYTIKTGKKSKFHTAASVGILSQRFNPNAIDVINQDDPYYLSLQQGKADNRFDLKVSACYQYSGFLLGFSTGRVTQPRFSYDYYNYRAQYSLSNISNAFTSARIKISREFILQPMVNVNLYDFSKALVQYGINLNAGDDFWVGLHSSGAKNISLQLGAQLRHSIRIGYSYSMPYSSSSQLLGSGHEFYTSISLGKTSELVKDLNYDAITLTRDMSDTANMSINDDNGEQNPNPPKGKVATPGNVVSVEKISLHNDTIVIASFDDMKFLKSGYDTAKIVFRDLPQSEFPKEGYYVTIGTFKNEGNANRFIKMMYTKSYTAYKFFHPDNKYFYVYILITESQDEADQVKWQEQLEFPDIWVKKVFRR